MILANKVTTFINMYLIHIYNLYNRFYKGFNRYYITSTMKEWMGTLLMPTTCLETVAEYHKWFASDIIIIYFHCFLSFLFKRKYILTISTVSYVIIQLLRSRYQTCKFLKWSKIIVGKILLILIAGIKQLWLFAWSSFWFWIPSTRLQCLEEIDLAEDGEDGSNVQGIVIIRFSRSSRPLDHHELRWFSEFARTIELWWLRFRPLRFLDDPVFTKTNEVTRCLPSNWFFDCRSCKS